MSFYRVEDGYYYFARGNEELNRRHFSGMPIEDRRSTAKMAHRLEFTHSLKANQVEPVNQLMASNLNGLLEAPPRFGKTVVVAHMVCSLGYKTLILAHQTDLCEQFLKTFLKFTNAIDLEYEAERQVVGIATKVSHIEKFDVCIMTYQMFLTRPDILEKYKDRFGAVIVDECHKASANRYSEVISSFNSTVRLGVSGTIERKDGFHIINDYVFGPVLARGTAEQVPCEVRVVKTNINIPYDHAKLGNKRWWAYTYNHLANDLRRNELIFSYLLAYMQAGHCGIAVTERTAQIDWLVKRLRDAGVAAQGFHRANFPDKKSREKVLNKCRSGEIQMLIAIRSMTLGLDIPRLTMFANLTPSANQPNYYQELSRIRTDYEGKKIAYILDFVDNHRVLEGAFLSRKKVYDNLKFTIYGDLY
jgi:superfamily II DNA or RNA helicase